MKVFVNGVLHDSDYGPIALIFENDYERVKIAELINDMPEKEGIRVLAKFPRNAEYIDTYMQNVYAAAGGTSATINITHKE